MTHPFDQLAPYVDGSLSAGERTEVEGHLASCSQCRSQISLATEARRALRALADVEIPGDLGAPALEAMEAESGPPWWVRAMPFVAAAAVVALLAVTLPRLGGGETAPSGADRAASPAIAARDLRLEVAETDFDADSLQAEAQASAERLTATDASSEGAALGTAAASTSKVEGPARSAEALRCLRTAFPDYPGDPVRLMQASFDGTPAYLAFVLEGPGAGQAADQMTVWVAARDDCSIVSLTSIKL